MSLYIRREMVDDVTSGRRQKVGAGRFGALFYAGCYLPRQVT